LRATAALTVFFHHANLYRLDAGIFGWLRRDIGHGAVVVFFVLSGYVIAATLGERPTARDYAIKRASRIYSVVVPALLLTYAVDLMILQLNLPVDVPEYELRRPILYGGFALLFAGDFWTIAVPSYSNVPFWSLNYEVWYYVAFGVLVFARGTVLLVLLSLVLALMGPKLWLLFPIWLGGAAVLALQKRVLLPRRLARIVVSACLVMMGAYFVCRVGPGIDEAGVELVSTYGPFPLRFSQWFLGDYVLGALMMALVYALGTAEIVLPRIVQSAGTSLAKVSFSLYVVHHPLLQFFGALLPGQGPVATALALACSLAFGAVFEPQRNRLRRVLTAATTRFA
jgi:peptidoglycan/LPS O-acetylase OafA/YrhL